MPASNRSQQQLVGRVREVLFRAGVTARLQEGYFDRPSLRLDDTVVIIEMAPGLYRVLLLDPVTGSYQVHGSYEGPHALEIALSEAIEHLTRYRMLGEHVPAESYQLCAHEDCLDTDAEVEFSGGEQCCAYHAVGAALSMLRSQEDRIQAVREGLSVPDQQQLYRELRVEMECYYPNQLPEWDAASRQLAARRRRRF